MNPTYPVQWQAIQAALTNQRLPQSLLMVAPLHYGLIEFALKIAQLAHCKNISDQASCDQCPDCQMVQRIEHPDLYWVKPEKAGSAIKIEQIRELHEIAFLAPQRSSYKLIIIESAERLNTAASNALLKILEEPSEHTHFILIAEQLATILPTILSRCQHLHFSSEKDIFLKNILELGTFYPEESERFKIINQADLLIKELTAVIEKKKEPCLLASEWNQYSLSDLLWFLYLVYAQINYLYIDSIPPSSSGYKGLMELKAILNPLTVFNQIEKINHILKKLSHNMNINSLLAIEDLLYSLAEK